MLLCFLYLDVDECFILSLNIPRLNEFQEQILNNTIPCSPDADCFNTLGSFSCQCTANFTGDGRTCSCKFALTYAVVPFCSFSKRMTQQTMTIDNSDISVILSSLLMECSALTSRTGQFLLEGAVLLTVYISIVLH